jgi:outer membrane protein TolC
MMTNCTIRPPLRLMSLFVSMNIVFRCAAQEPPVRQPAAGPQSAPVIDLQGALRRARAFSPQLKAATVNAAVAHENRLQARAARLPTVNAVNQFVYTQGNGTPSGVFIANDGVHVYSEQAVVRENLFALARTGQVRQAQAAEEVAKAQEAIASRGLVFTVVRAYYNLVAAQRERLNAGRSLDEARQFVEITQKQEFAGEVSHVDVVKAELAFEQRSRDIEVAGLTEEEARLALTVLLFADFDQSFTVVDDLSTLPPLLPLNDLQSFGSPKSPEIQSAQASVKEARYALSVARYAYLPSLAVTFYYGIDANQFAARTSSPTPGVNRSNLPNFLVPQRQNLGFAGDITLDVPVWNWGATRSKVRQAEYRQTLAQQTLTFAERQHRAALRSQYRQAEVAQREVASLRRSLDYSTENDRLTTLRYEAGEASALEVVIAQDTLALARKTYDAGLSHYRIALVDLQTLTGRL